MKTMKTLLLVGLVVAIGTIAGVVIVQRQAARATARQTANAQREADRNQARNQARPMAVTVMAPADPKPLPSQEIVTSSDSVSQASLTKAEGQTKVKEQPAKTVQAPPANAGSQTPPAKAAIMDPMARSALSFVGTDPDAEEYWIGAINDPSLSTHERQDLIEDLNEDGLSDPEHPTMEDLPLIVNRLWLIETLAPDAMDQVNADAFLEAYKDLLNLYAGLTQR